LQLAAGGIGSMKIGRFDAHLGSRISARRTASPAPAHVRGPIVHARETRPSNGILRFDFGS
jgi:hypothetical protein